MYMNKPKMILFDYGQTLVAERNFKGVDGTRAVMAHAVENRYNLTPEEVQAKADEINKELGRFDPKTRWKTTVEIPNHTFTGYLYESLGIKLDLTSQEIDRIFWDAASPGEPTKGMPELLEFLWKEGIMTAVLSNITYDGDVVKERINRLLPDNHFEFIIPTSDYLFRKPSPHIFALALEKAQLKPEDVWYIGDNLFCDVYGARSAGMYPIWYRGANDFPQPECDDVIKIYDWERLKEIIGDTED